MMDERGKDGKGAWTITVVGGEGDEETVRINERAPLHQLLQRGVKALYGEARVEDYDIVIGGVPQDDLEKTLTEVGLADGAEVTILTKDVSRGTLGRGTHR